MPATDNGQTTPSDLAVPTRPTYDPHTHRPAARRGRSDPRSKIDAEGRCDPVFSAQDLKTRETPRELRPKPLPSRDSPCWPDLSVQPAASRRPKPARGVALPTRSQIRRPGAGASRGKLAPFRERSVWTVAALSSRCRRFGCPRQQQGHCTHHFLLRSRPATPVFSRSSFLFRAPAVTSPNGPTSNVYR